MGQFAPIISIVSTVLGTAMSFKSQSDAASFQKQEARDAARNAEIDAKNLERTSAIEASNLSKLQAREESFNRAKAFASGVAVDESNSFGLVMAEQRQTNVEQMANLRESGASQAESIRRQGESAYGAGMARADSSKAGAYGSLLSGAKDVFATGEAANWKLWG